MDKVISEKTDVMNAMHRDDVGDISFLYGTPGTGEKLKHGWGISHLIARRNQQGYNGEDIARKMVEVIAKGDLSKRYYENTEQERANITYDGYEAHLALYRFGKKQTWLITGYKITNKASDVAGELSGSSSTTLSEGIPRPVKEGAEAIKQSLASKSDNVKDSEIYNQAGYNPKKAIAEWFKNTKDRIKNLFTSSVEVKTQTQNSSDLEFRHSKEGERRYVEASRGVRPPSFKERVNNVGRKIAECFKGNFSNLNALIHLSAKEEFRALKNRVSAAQKQAAKTFKENLGKLNDYEMDLFGRMRLLDDLVWRKNKVKDAKLPFNFTDESLRSEHERFKKMVEENPKVKAAIEAEERVNRGITGEFVSLAKELGFKIDDIFSNPHYYRHIVLEYANAAGVVRDGKNGGFITGDSSDPAVRKMREILGRDYMKRYKGSDKDISTDYTQANFEVRAQMLADIEVMKTIKKIKQQ